MGLSDRDYLRADDADARAAVRSASAGVRFAGLAALVLIVVALWQAAAGRWPLLVIVGAAGLLVLLVRGATRRRGPSRPTAPPPTDELDALLARVSAVGMDGLTEAERAALTRASEAVRQRRGY